MWVGFCFGCEKKNCQNKTFETLVYFCNSIVLSMFKTHICFVWLLCETVECVLIVFIPFCYPDSGFGKKKILALEKNWQQNLIFSRWHQSIASISTQFFFFTILIACFIDSCLYEWSIALLWFERLFFSKKNKKNFFFVFFCGFFCSSRV